MMIKMVTLIYMPSAVQFACFSVTFGIIYVNIIIILLYRATTLPQARVHIHRSIVRGVHELILVAQTF